MKKSLVLAGLALLCLYGAFHFSQWASSNFQRQGNEPAIAIAFRHHLSGIHVTGTGVVVRLLPDDTTGIRHQRFILRLPWEQTILIAHNLDVAPRVKDLKRGDKIEFSGEYAWNPQGGIVHWTHHAPHGHHRSGWIRHGGHLYE